MMKIVPLPALAYLRECFILSKEGDLFWKRRPASHFASKGIRARWNGRYAGKIAGTIERGYRKINLDGHSYYSHRMVFFMVRGSDPMDARIDHRDGNPANNRPANLRLATVHQNSQNSAAPFDNKSGVKGVSWRTKESRWIAQIQGDGKKFAARFDSLEAASQWVRAKRIELHGPFARHS